MKTYDLEKMQALLRDFYNLTKMKICIYDQEENELCYYPEKMSAFCALLRTDPVMDARCRECDRLAFAACKRTRKQYSYTCHAGLVECVSPILHQNNIVGYIVIGQIKAQGQDEFAQIAAALPPALHEPLERHFANALSVPMDKLHSALRILDACAGYEYLKELVHHMEQQIDRSLDDFIQKELERDLSVSMLCETFRLSRSELYQIFRTHFHTTPAEYIKNCRLHRACELLRQTRLPVHAIAKACGIPDYNYFSKVFKRSFAVSPREFRKA